MSIHICRDFLTKFALAPPYAALYVAGMFLRGVMNFTMVGQTNFNIDSGSITKGFGTANASINQGASNEFAVAVPSGSYVVSVADVNRILALRSTLHPMHNSGLFRVTGVNSASNWFYVLDRSLDQPPPEVGLSWRLFEKEASVLSTFVNDTNETPGVSDTSYHGNGSSNTSRIILQSNHSTAWQVRVCAEWFEDCGTNLSFHGHIGAACSFTPGFSGDSRGDFAIGGQHLHIPLWFDAVDQDSLAIYGTNGSCPGMGSIENGNSNPATSILAQRYYLWGDDSTGTVCMIARQAGFTAFSVSGESIVTFGLPEDEEQPLPATAIHRLFTFGTTTRAAAIEMEAGNRLGGQAQMGVAFGLGNQPVSCIPSSFCYLAGNALDSSIANDSNASDNIYLGATDLYPWDLIAGTWDYTETSTDPYLLLEPRRMGRFPMARRGRENFNLFSTTVDVERSYLHVGSGIFLPWSGSILP